MSLNRDYTVRSKIYSGLVRGGLIWICTLSKLNFKPILMVLNLKNKKMINAISINKTGNFIKLKSIMGPNPF